ncbi:MAG: phosphoribosylformylglycinamidine cyclo-ligase [Ignavibacteriae bacterium]|nr:phosphoribosylformylglycinamidine cyclo-ligase [Ignavibacteriota bacterium]
MKTYKKAGVNIPAGDELVRRIRDKVRSTFSRGVLADIGAFAAFYDGKFRGVRQPVLVSSVDGVGTKLKVAFMMKKHDTVGQDLVNHCVNDIAVCGAQPLFFLDYFATGKLSPSITESVVKGMVKACKENSCSLIGGETAEMPGFYHEHEYDVAGMIVGVAEKKTLFNEKRVKAGDSLIGLPSTGLHTNGYSLARAVLFERYKVDNYVEELGTTLGAALLTIHRSYLQAIMTVKHFAETHAFAHITGGGLVANVSRVVPKGLTVNIDWQRWERPAVFKLIQKCGNVPEDDMRRTFNLGVGLVIVTSQRGTDKVMDTLRQHGEAPFVIGSVVKK